MSTLVPQRVRRYARATMRRVADPVAYLPWGPPAPTAAPRVGLVGFYGWGNYGDELFGEVFREHLTAPLGLRTILDPDPGRWTGGGGRLGSSVRSADALVIGGGDIVIPWASSNRYWEPIFLRRPVFVAGVGVPTFRESTPGAVGRLRRFFQDPAVRYISTRDPVSTAWIREHLAPAIEVATAPDLVCALTLPPADRPADPPIFGVAVRQRATVDDFSQVRRLAERATALGYRVRRIVLATGRTRVRDLEATARLGLEGTELVASDDLAVISRAIGECTAMASMKFHGVVVAAMYGVPALVMMPTAKNRYFLDLIGRPDLLTGFNHPDLPDLVTRDPVPIAAPVRERLRDQATAGLADLRRAILETAAGR